jgi:hypothetical protein
MVNPGHPCRGCLTCRFRRIKCDETRPTCYRCAKSKHPCLGYNVQSLSQLRCSRGPQNGPAGHRSTMPRLLSSSSASLDVHGSLTASQQTRAHPAVHNVIALMEASFGSLSAESQTLSARKKLQQKYQDSIRNLASSLSSQDESASSDLSSYLFALYEVSWRSKIPQIIG